MVDPQQTTPQQDINANVNPEQESSQGVFGGNGNAFDVMAAGPTPTPDASEPIIDPFLQQTPSEQADITPTNDSDVHVPDPFLTDPNTQDVQADQGNQDSDQGQSSQNMQVEEVPDPFLTIDGENTPESQDQTQMPASDSVDMPDPFMSDANAADTVQVEQTREEVMGDVDATSSVSEPQEEYIETIPSEDSAQGPEVMSQEPEAVKTVEQTIPEIMSDEPGANSDQPLDNTEITEPVVDEDREEEPEDNRPNYLAKLQELIASIHQAVELQQELDPQAESHIQILGADNDKLTIEYTITAQGEPMQATLTKSELQKTSNEQSENTLTFMAADDDIFTVMINELELYTASILDDDQTKKMQVMDKMNKFIFLVNQKVKELQDQIDAKKENKEQYKQAQNTFRNF